MPLWSLHSLSPGQLSAALLLGEQEPACSTSCQLITALCVLHPGWEEPVASKPERAQAVMSLYRELVLPTHSKGLLMGDAHACSGPCARQQASRGKNTLSQISLCERGDIPDHIPSPDLCLCATTQAGSSFAWQELLLGEFVPRLLFTRWFSLWMLLLHSV